MKHHALLSVLLMMVLTSSLAYAARSTPAVRPAAYRNLNLAQQYSDAKDFDKALNELSTLQRGEARLNGYERAMMYNLFGFIHFSQQDLPSAIAAYEQVISDVSVIPEALEATTHYGLAQLYFGSENYPAAIKAMQQWQTQTGKNTLQAELLIAQSYYQLKQYAKGIAPMQNAIALAKADGKSKPEENWLLLLRVFYFEAGQKSNATAVMEQLVELYPSKQYWLQLATIYGQQNKTKLQLNAMATLYRQNLLNSESELLNYAQMLLSAEVPMQAAEVLAAGLNAGTIEKNLENLSTQARALSQAKEYEQAVEVYLQADAFDSTATSLFDAARLLVLQQQWQQTADVLANASSKGSVPRMDQLWLMLGMAQFNLKQFNQARVSFNEAKSDARSDKVARQWLNYVNSEQQRQEAIADYL